MAGGPELHSKLEGYLKKMARDLVEGDTESVARDIRLALRLIEDETKGKKK